MQSDTSYVEKLNRGDILLTFKANNFFSELIYLFSRKKKDDPRISHALIYLGGPIAIESSFHGVQVVNLKKYSSKKYIIHAVRIRGLNIDYGLDYAFDNIGVSYSWLQLLWILIKRVFKIKSAVDVSSGQVCSEFVSNYSLAGGVKLDDEISAETSPLDIYSSQKVEKII